jgi:glutamyl-tRNA synthetase
MAQSDIRVRFAPSPTGPLHLGGVRTALYNYLFARKNNGTFILRIEDTDRTRYIEGAEKYIINSLKWCGLDFDEGVEQGGDYAPYRQSERYRLYRHHAQKMVQEGTAYYAFDTAEELNAMRERLKEQKSDIQQYNAVTREEMKNSLTLSEDEVKYRIDKGEPYVVRFKMTEDQHIVVNDLIRGEVEVNTNQLDDKILFKSDGMPTYHLANVVDDHEMKISHVIRGEEWLPSLPLHFMLYEALGWEDELPVFAHLPLILKPNGNGKLSKRDGEKHGFPVFPMKWKDPETGEVFKGYKESGYLPEAFVNMLAFLGWNPGTDRELYTLDELIESFDLEKVGKAGSKFDPDKADGSIISIS